MLFKDRFHAGRLLARKLERYRDDPEILVLALPRGGVPVAAEVARALEAPLDVFLVRKLGLPGHSELAMGAVATGGVRVLNEDLVARLGIPDSVIDKVAQRELEVLRRQDHRFRGGQPPPAIAGRTIILIDDGLATGSTMRAAVEAIQKQRPRRLVVGAPIGAAETCDQFSRDVDEMVAVACPDDFRAVAMWYEDFSQTPDAVVIKLLQEAAARRRKTEEQAGVEGGDVLPLPAMEHVTRNDAIDPSHSL
jgi:predicted phosphoribosyltransferase